MEKKHYAAERKTFPLSLLFTLSVFMMLAMSMSVAGDQNYMVSTDGIYAIDEGEVSDIANISYDTSTHTLTLGTSGNANIQGTFIFNSATKQGTNEDNIPEMFETHYTIFLQPGTKSTLYHLQLMERVVITVKGEGELYVVAPETDNDGAALSFNPDYSTSNTSKLIIEGGTVTFDANYLDAAIKESGCLYVKDGAKSVTIIGQTHTNKDNAETSVNGPVILSEKSAVPKIFSDYPCQATYIPSVKNGKSVILSPDGTSNGSSDKTISDASLLGNEYDQFHKLVFKPGYTATWQNDDANQTVLEEDKHYYWAGQTPEYNGDTPTKAKDAQYTYTFSKWTPTPGAIYKDTVYKAVYTKTVNKYTAAFNANGHGTAPASQTIDYGNTITKPTDPTADGYAFGGWYKEAACTNAFDFSTTVTGNITLYAKWTEKDTTATETTEKGTTATETTEKGTTATETTEKGTTETAVVPKTPDTPVPTVTGMEAVTSAAITTEEKAKIASGEINVNIKLEAEKKSEKSAEGSKKIKKMVSSGNSVNMYLDLSLLKYVTTNATGSTATTDLGSSNSVVIRVQIPYDTARQNIEIIRYHNAIAQAFTKLKTEPTEGYADGTYFVGNGFVALYASGFSTYAIADSGYKKKEEKKTTKADTFITITKVKHSDSKIKLAWQPVSGAQGYDIFAALCGRNIQSKPTMTVKGTKATLKKAYAKTRNVRINADCIKYVIKAYKKVNGKKKYIAKSKICHTVGPNHNLYSDAKKITTKKSKYTLKVGKSAKLNARVKTYNGNGQVAHSKTIKYVSSDKSVATVNKKGKIKAVGKGTCKIYVVSACGLTKVVKVTVNK